MKSRSLLIFLIILNVSLRAEKHPAQTSGYAEDPVIRQMENARQQLQLADSLLMQQMLAAGYDSGKQTGLTDGQEVLQRKVRRAVGLMEIAWLTMSLMVSGILLYFVHSYLRNVIARTIKTRQGAFMGVKIKDYPVLYPEQQLRLVIMFARMLRLMLIIFLAYLALLIIFSLFPWTEGIAKKLFSLVYLPFRKILNAGLQYLPNLLIVTPVIAVSYYLMKIVDHLKLEISSGRLNIKGFHHDFLSPTATLLKIMIFILTLIVTYPYLPGSQTKIFQGITLFLGILLSLGSSSVVANIIAGLISIYMRPFKVGDYIRIGGVTGNVMEKNILITRIRTSKNEEITIPNSNILTGFTVNFSAVAREQGYVLSTVIVVSYKIPWEVVHEQLVNAALCIPNILQDPAPFVCQTRLSRHAATYELNAYTNCPERMDLTYSLLHQQIQNNFKKSGIFLQDISSSSDQVPHEQRPQ